MAKKLPVKHRSANARLANHYLDPREHSRRQHPFLGSQPQRPRERGTTPRDHSRSPPLPAACDGGIATSWPYYARASARAGTHLLGRLPATSGSHHAAIMWPDTVAAITAITPRGSV